MLPTQKGSFRLFRLAGVTVYLHWMWFLVVWFLIAERQFIPGGSALWNACAGFLLFSVVLMHEFGHALACRSVGGRADTIVLWPLGGVAYVDAPQRPGAMLWSIVAGPLVNVVLLIFCVVVMIASKAIGWWEAYPRIALPVLLLFYINVGLLCFNLLPIYPLDGGKILWSLLWFPLGRGKSLMIAAILGIIGAVGLIGVALWKRELWLGLVVVFMVVNCWSGLQQAKILIKMDRLPRRTGYSCPSCRAAPLWGAYWQCNHCGTAFDTFETRATCPACGARFNTTRCTDCGNTSPLIAWGLVPAPPPIPPVAAE